MIQNGGTVLGVAVSHGEQPGSVRFHNIPGQLPKDPAGYTYQYMQDAAKQHQSGGRYGFDPAIASTLYGSNGVGYASPGPTSSVKCEAGSTNALNADPALQMQTTNPNPSDVPGWSRQFNPLRGGSRKRRGSKKRKSQTLPPHMRPSQKKKRSQQGGGTNAENLANLPPQVFAGQIDSMKYNAPTAGYSWEPLRPAVQQNPDVSNWRTYDARHFNSACMKTN